MSGAMKRRRLRCGAVTERVQDPFEGSSFEDAKFSQTSSDSKVVSARGTEDGLVLRIDGKASWSDILKDIESFLGGRKKFFEGGHVSLEWLDRLPTIEQSRELETLLKTVYGVEIVVKRKRPGRLAVAGEAEGETNGAANSVNNAQAVAASSASNAGAGMKQLPAGKDMRQKRSGVTINLFDEVVPEESQTLSSNISVEPSLGSRDSGSKDFGELGESFGSGGGKKYASRMAKMLGDDLFYEDDANAKVFFGTLRSGQRLETPFSLIVVGDVNPGADLVAGGDIIVFGGLRGTAHASAYDDDAYDRVIIALQMQPMQLRIGSVISRGSDERVKGAEIARIDSRRIIVEAFNPKVLAAGLPAVGGKRFR